MKRFLVALIRWYQKTLSPDHGPSHQATCRFIPTCSEYGVAAIEKYGIRGVFMTLWRIIRCNPLMTKGGTVETVP